MHETTHGFEAWLAVVAPDNPQPIRRAREVWGELVALDYEEGSLNDARREAELMPTRKRLGEHKCALHDWKRLNKIPPQWMRRAIRTAIYAKGEGVAAGLPAADRPAFIRGFDTAAAMAISFQPATE